MPGRSLKWMKALLLAGSAVLFSSGAEAASIVTEWLDVALPAVDYVTPEPTTSTRFLAIYHGAIYEAWAAYDGRAVGLVTGDLLQGEGGPATIANEREAISHAAYAALSALAPVHQRFFDARMAQLGYDPASKSAPARLGRRAAAAVLASRRGDGSNAENDYADTTAYMVADASHASHWQPIQSAGTAQIAMTPHWRGVTPFALPRADAFRPAPPPEPGSDAFAAQTREVLDLSAELSDEHKAIAEFWVPWGAPPASQLMSLTKWVSLRNDMRLDDDVKLFFLVSNALLDAGIAAWDAKYQYDYVRPITAVHALGDQMIEAWRPGGTASMEARDWQPYLSTVPFPEYVSGHSAFTAAWARALELTTGSAEFGFAAKVKRLSVENRTLEPPVELAYPTFQSAAEASGMSRLHGGIHWMAGNRSGLELGRKVGGNAWTHAQGLFSGRAQPATAALSHLAPPLWRFVRDKGALRPVASTEGGLGLFVPTGADDGLVAGAWRSETLDPLPAGTYRLSLEIARAEIARTLDGDDEAPLLGVSVEATNGTVLAALPPAVVAGEGVALDWSSDGTTPFRITVRLHGGGETAGAGFTVIGIRNTRRIM